MRYTFQFSLAQRLMPSTFFQLTRHSDLAASQVARHVVIQPKPLFEKNGHLMPDLVKPCLGRETQMAEEEWTKHQLVHTFEICIFHFHYGSNLTSSGIQESMQNVNCTLKIVGKYCLYAK